MNRRSHLSHSYGRLQCSVKRGVVLTSSSPELDSIKQNPLYIYIYKITNKLVNNQF